MPEFLLEIASEEIPAGMQVSAAAALRQRIGEGFTEAGLPFGETFELAGPRRLAVVARDVAERQPDLSEERRGPKADAPEKAVAGFLRSCGLSFREELEERDTPKGRFLFAIIERKGQATTDILPGIIAGAMAGISWPKSMRWGEGEFTWVRPLRSVFCLFDGATLSGPVPLTGTDIAFSDSVSGHRHLSTGPVSPRDFESYSAELEAAKVIVDQAVRQERIAEDLATLATADGLALREDPALLDEVVGLVEWPVTALGAIDANFMALPEEVLVASMRTHQKYFALLDSGGAMASRFAVVMNTEPAGGSATVVAGNERVLRARLTDAEFFWNQDRGIPLADRATRLKDVVFHAKLGTLDEKTDRMQALATRICGWVPGADRNGVRSSARLAKADLVSGMVGEFPELQGVIGRYYALHDGESAEVATAIAEHYAPQGPDDICPAAPVSVCVALADKVDTLVGFWSIDEKPTGTRDPYALRRAALGVIRLITENHIHLPLSELLTHAAGLYREVGQGFDIDDLMAFIARRLEVYLRGTGASHDLIDAVFALDGEDDLVRLLARVRALGAFIETDDGANLLVAYRRAANIVAIEDGKDGVARSGPADRAAFAGEEETVLAGALDTASEEISGALGGGDFEGAMAAMARLRRPVDRFFDKVTVNAEDPALRDNRLKLLAEIRETMNQVANFGRLEG